MNRILVVGATGQLGMAASRKLLAEGRDLRVIVRNSESAARFRELGAEAVMGDLTDPASLASACAGIHTLVATANAAIPVRKTDTFEAVERRGYADLIRAARDAGVQRFVYTSVLRSAYERHSAFFRYKRETEDLLANSGMDYVIFRADVFMDVAFAMIGSTIPLRGAEAATVLRPYKFTTRHFERIKNNLERDHLATIPGDGRARHAYVCIEDVASFLAAAASSSRKGIYDVGGPEPLSMRDIVHLYEKILGYPIRVKYAPAVVFRIAASVLKPFSPAGANLMFLNYISAVEETLSHSARAVADFGVRLTSAEAFLRSKYAMIGAAVA
jgi:NADH dehydrogenase